jgi:hypothetical protein
LPRNPAKICIVPKLNRKYFLYFLLKNWRRARVFSFRRTAPQSPRVVAPGTQPQALGAQMLKKMGVK